MSILVIVALMELLIGAWNAPAGSLGEVAFREAVRRQSTPPSVRTLTDADLDPAPARPARTQSPPGVSADETTPGAKFRLKPEGNGVEAPAPRDEAWWRARLVQARIAVERDGVLVDALESRVAALTRDAANRDDPMQRAALVADRLRAMEELDRMRKQVDADTQEIADIEDEARRAGVPPGWLRGGLEPVSR